MMMFHLIVGFLVVKINDAQVKITVAHQRLKEFDWL